MVTIAKREGYGIIGREVERYDTGYQDLQRRPVHYETTIEAIADADAPTTPRTWRVWGRQLRGGHPLGRPSVPQHVYSVRDARALARTLFHKHCRYLERNSVKYAHLQALEQDEEGERHDG